MGLIYSYVRTKGKFDILDLISSVLGSLVSVTGESFVHQAIASNHPLFP